MSVRDLRGEADWESYPMSMKLVVCTLPAIYRQISNFYNAQSVA